MLVKGSDTSSYDESGCSFSIHPSNVMNRALVLNSFNPGSTLLASLYLIIVALDSHFKPPAIFHPNSLTPADVQLAPQRPTRMTLAGQVNDLLVSHHSYPSTHSKTKNVSTRPNIQASLNPLSYISSTCPLPDISWLRHSLCSPNLARGRANEARNSNFD